jgi:nucleotide-binding universal stress UspA family protein
MRDVTKPVLVTVDELPGEEAALHFAGREAVLRDCPLRVVHVLHSGLASSLHADEAAEAEAHALVARAARHLHALTEGSVDVTVLTPRGSVLDTLVALADDARLVVVQHRHLARVSRILTASTSARLAARSAVPVVSVPSTWASRDRAVARVVVGVDDIARSVPLLRSAISLAQLHGADLHVVHALELPLPDAIDDAGTERLLPVWHEQATIQLESVLRLAHAEFPRVAVRSVVVDGRPAQALASMTRHDDLLVLGRRPAAHLGHGQLGRVARLLLARAGCPVMVFPLSPVASPAPEEARHAHR